ncbi:hypothetical protein BU26DRAFT_329871 [Trematosphaeria pertusa]|uniref:Peptidase M43 pregnancy-associated plasma-A domain-containing protein n=1 Tax=Trematosphaeria pertusa TaxID=390896 RepID=A0A6A6IDF0_9PLEO|nr:uncharacterized protein BU26DRAFT_329871 [Trematosphaeria pertusa]KAF2248239.1 hypothetical protein BU26DRAFT_329871 [Trematosphaeria pertusa]
MKLFTLALAALAPLTAFAADQCLNEDFDHDPLNISPSASRRALNSLRTRDLTHVELYIHVLVSQAPTDDWGPSIQGQLDFLNNHYEVWGYHFDLKLTTYVINAEWASDIDTDKENKMHQLHRGDYQTLNVYLVEGAGGGVCSLPDGSGDPVQQNLLDFDGCFVPLEVGRSATSGTLAHEVGHWFGLLHTFQGGCDGDGDYCDDTAPQSEPSYAHLATPGDLGSCPAPDQCGKGPANVKNFMDYTDCSQEFTPCQGGRMNVAWTQYRNGRKLADGVKVTW